MTTARLVALVLAPAVFLVNPAVGCSTGDPDFEFDADDMKAAVAGTWAFSPDGGSGPQVTFVLRYGSAGGQARAGSWIRPAAACTSRSFVSSAAACVVVSTMRLDGEVTAGQGPYASGAVTADFMAFGSRYTGGALSVRLPNGDHLEAQIAASSGAVARASLFASSGAATGAGDLRRLAP